MARNPAKPGNPGRRGAAKQQEPAPKPPRKQSAEKRLSAVFDALTDEILTTLENNYDRKER